MSTATVHIKSRLYLHAVIPALQMLVLIDPESRSLASRLRTPLRLRVGKKESLTLAPHNGELAFGRDGGIPGSFSLWFPTDRQFLKLMEKRGLPLVLPASFRISPGSLRLFSSLMKRLEWYLKPVNPQETPRDELARRVHLQLAVATASVPILGLLDGPSRRELAHLPAGLALFSCDPSLPSCWVRVAQGKASSGMGPNPPEDPLVQVHFNDPWTAYEGLAERLDQLAAVCTGKIRVQGLLPLADGLDLVLGRVSRYLPNA